jgi:hypothetical protein
LKVNLHQFNTQIEAILPNVTKWQVRKMALEARHQVILDYECYLRLLKIATAQSLHFQPREIVSWLDNIVMIDRLIKRFPESLIHQCSLVLEHHILPSFKRIDALLYHKGKYAMLESTYDDGQTNPDQEHLQLASYQRLLQAQLGSRVQIMGFWLPIVPEYNEQGALIDSTFVEKNNQTLDDIALKITLFLS